MEQPNQPQHLQAPNDDQVGWARSVIDNAFNPALKRMIDTLNTELSVRGLRAGIEIQWFFENIEVPQKGGV